METFSALLALCVGNSSVIGEFPSQRPVTRALMFSLTCTWLMGWVNNREAGDLRRHRAHYDVTAIWMIVHWTTSCRLIILIHFHDILINAWKQQRALPLHVGGVIQRLPLYDNLVYLVTICQYHILQHTGGRRHQDFHRYFNGVNGVFVSITIYFGGNDNKYKHIIIYSACERFIRHKQIMYGRCYP